MNTKLKSYLQFRRALRVYYQYECPRYRDVILGRKMSKRWRAEYGHFILGLTVLCSDATCAVMLS